MTGFIARRVDASLGSVIESPHKLGSLCFDLQSFGGPLVDVKALAPHVTQVVFAQCAVVPVRISAPATAVGGSSAAAIHHRSDNKDNYSGDQYGQWWT